MNLRRGAWIALFLAFVGSLGVWGEPVDSGVAKDVATAFIDSDLGQSVIYRASMGMASEVQVDSAGTLTDGTTPEPLAYVHELEPTGYIVVTTDTRLVPIVAYSYTSAFSWKESPQNILLDMLRQDLANRLRALEDGAIAAEVIEDNERRWDELRGLRSPDRHTYVSGVYGPWTTDPSWTQRSPYWDDCPLDPVTSTRSVVGCVGTALAQILNYWQTPTSVTFVSGDSYTTDTRSIWINAPGASFTGLAYNSCNPSDAAKADLSYAAGVSVQMDYTSGGSSAFVSEVSRALAGTAGPNFSNTPNVDQRWGYHSADLRTYSESWGSPWQVSQTTFYNDLKGNMMLARPAVLGIESSSSGAGHAILVDGYHPTNEDYHLNYGWGGTNDGWYSLPSTLPGPSAAYDYDVIDEAVYNIVPTTSTYTLWTTTSGTGSGTVQALPGTGALTRGTHVLVSAAASPGSTFDHWSGALTGSDNPAMVILDGSKTVNAVFTGTGGDPNIVVSGTTTIDVAPGSTGTTTMSIQNTGASNLIWSISLWSSSPYAAGDPDYAGGPDTYGYTWYDSNDGGGPTYDWVDITGNGTPLNLGDDDHSAAIPLPFTFRFYGQAKTRSMWDRMASSASARATIPSSTNASPMVSYRTTSSPRSGTI